MLVTILIFLSRVVDVTLMTFRTLMVVQGRKVPAAILGFFEVGVYVIALGKVVGSLDHLPHLISYCLGFAAGNYVGIQLENRLALGMLSAKITVKGDSSPEMISDLRDHGFGVTEIDARGKDGPRKMLSMVFNRKDLRNLEEIVKSYDNSAFMVVNSASPITGGFIRRRSLKK